MASLSTLLNISWMPWSIFVVFSIIFVIISRPLANKFLKTSSRAANVDALVNQKANVIDDISPKKYGRVKVEGEEWLAESDEEIKKGEWVKILKVSGVKLVVKKSSD